MAADIWLWGGFLAFVLGMLALDLGVFHRKAHAVSMKEAAGWSVFWISLALLFNAGLYFYAGAQPALEFLTGYLIEKSLSVDNIFVFVMVFSAFGVPAVYQHRVLFYGILGALVMRGLLIGAGSYLVHQFSWIMYLFGAFLVVTGIRMALQGESETEVQNHSIVQMVRRLVPVTPGFHGASFVVRANGMLFATPLLVTLVLVELTDLMFAVDSIPAIFAVTQDPFLVFTSNVFAILGLRSLYFLLAGVVDKFHLLKLGLSAILSLVGVKMLLIDLYKIPIGLSLGVIAGVLALSVAASLLFPKKEAHTAALPIPAHDEEQVS